MKHLPNFAIWLSGNLRVVVMAVAVGCGYCGLGFKSRHASSSSSIACRRRVDFGGIGVTGAGASREDRHVRSIQVSGIVAFSGCYTSEEQCIATDAARRDTYPRSSSNATGYLKVSELHTIYYETFGNAAGQPAVFLHGGPGAGCTARHAQFFDPSHYQIVLFDQRGCGKSTPRGSLEENTTWDVVDDIEKLRKHLGVERWMVLGGSWGVTLALAYAQTYPDAVLALVLRGVCLFRQKEVDWIYKQGANSLFPFSWNKLLSVLEPAERMDVLASFYKRLTSSDAPTQLSAAHVWLSWEMALSFFSASQALFWDGKEYSNSSLGQEPKITSTSNTRQPRSHSSVSWTTSGDSKMPSQVVQARLECHFSMRNGFLKENQLLDGMSKIRHIPGVIVHGRFDFVCPLANAFDLHQAWPEAELRVVPNAGHSMYEKGISEEIIRATELLRKL